MLTLSYPSVTPDLPFLFSQAHPTTGSHSTARVRRGLPCAMQGSEAGIGVPPQEGCSPRTSLPVQRVPARAALEEPSETSWAEKPRAQVDGRQGSLRGAGGVVRLCTALAGSAPRLALSLCHLMPGRLGARFIDRAVRTTSRSTSAGLKFSGLRSRSALHGTIGHFQSFQSRLCTRKEGRHGRPSEDNPRSQ